MVNLKKCTALFVTALLAASSLTGCGLLSSSMVHEADYTEMVTLSSVEDSMTIIERPGIVEEIEKPDKTLYNSMFFMSTNALGAVNVLEENGYFNYDLLETEDFEELDRITEPTNISVIFYSNKNHSDWRIRFSCFIYKIEDDYIYLGTAGHCIANLEYARFAEITFFNRERVCTSMEEYKLGGNFSSRQGDYAMYRIKTADVPYDLLLQLKEATYDPEAVLAVSGGDTIYSGNIYCQHQDDDYDMKMIVYGEDSDAYKSYTDYWSYLATGNYFITKGHLVSGQSGSAIFDRYGHVIGVCSGMASGGGYPEIGIMTAIHYMDELYQQFIEDDIAKGK